MSYSTNLTKFTGPRTEKRNSGNCRCPAPPQKGGRCAERKEDSGSLKRGPCRGEGVPIFGVTELLCVAIGCVWRSRVSRSSPVRGQMGSNTPDHGGHQRISVRPYFLRLKRVAWLYLFVLPAMRKGGNFSTCGRVPRHPHVIHLKHYKRGGWDPPECSRPSTLQERKKERYPREDASSTDAPR
jgi:hypothetical protein